MKYASYLGAFLFAMAAAGCGGDTTTAGGAADVTGCSPTTTSQYVINSLKVPESNHDYAIDINGDGKVDNQLGNIISILAAQNIDTQAGVDSAVAAGDLIILIDEKSSDATFQADACAGADIQLGLAHATPDYTGAGTFTVDTASPEGSFLGKIVAGKFASNSPLTTTHPVTTDIRVPLVSNAAPVDLTISGAQLVFTRDSTGKLTGGEIHGSIKSTDVQNKIIPNVATLLTNKATTDPAGNMQIISLFDTGGAPDPSCASGGCKNPTSVGDRQGMCAVAADSIIDTCEVSTNSLIKSVLGPDVKMYDDSGNYKPSTAKKGLDSLSIGLGFSAVPAKF